jgi:hypothetical protein
LDVIPKRQEVTAMVSKLSNIKQQQSARRTTAAAAHDEQTVYGPCDAPTLAAIDRVADQMLMPRSWVVTQILREWAERRSTEIGGLEQSWNGSYREQLGIEPA